MLSILGSFALLVADVFNEFFHIVAIIWGGLVLWAAIVITRFIFRNSSPRRRR